ncbi:MAG TPA: hypothetical protein VM182_12715 [Terriglobia bacterium]|nr:hypothetical protein [Terriglobia bacterium]
MATFLLCYPKQREVCCVLPLAGLVPQEGKGVLSKRYSFDKKGIEDEGGAGQGKPRADILPPIERQCPHTCVFARDCHRPEV